MTHGIGTGIGFRSTLVTSSLDTTVVRAGIVVVVIGITTSVAVVVSDKPSSSVTVKRIV